MGGTFNGTNSLEREDLIRLSIDFGDVGYLSGAVFKVNNSQSGGLVGTKVEGPCVITRIRDMDLDETFGKIVYEINEIDKPAKDYRISLDNDGNRLAVAQREGTNTVIQTFEFDGSSWNQIGDDLEF